MFNRNLKFRFHRRDAPVPVQRGQGVGPAGSTGAELRRSGESLLAKRPCSRAGRAGCGACSRRGTEGRDPNDIAIRDIVRNTQSNAATEQSLNPNHRYQRTRRSATSRRSRRRQPPRLQGRTHCPGKDQYDRIRNGDLFLEPTTVSRCARIRQHAGGVGSPAADLVGVRAGSVGSSAGRRINYGVAFDGVKAFCRRQRARPAPSSRAVVAMNDLYNFNLNVAPRVGVSYDIFGKGRTRAEGGLLPLLQPVRLGDRRGDQPECPHQRADSVDRPRQRPAARSRANLANFTGFTGVFRGCTPCDRPYSTR